MLLSLSVLVLDLFQHEEIVGLTGQYHYKTYSNILHTMMCYIHIYTIDILKFDFFHITENKLVDCMCRTCGSVLHGVCLRRSQ